MSECLSYVVSRSGKVLDSSGRVLQEIVPANVQDLTYARPLASFEGQPESFFNFAAFLLAEESPPPPPAMTRKRKSRQRSKPKATAAENRRTLVWEDDINSSLDDIARAILRRHKHKRVRRGSRKQLHAGSENTGGYNEMHRRLVQHLQVGVSQMFILQRWQPGSRELPARWASWLLKMLRKPRPPPQALQKFLFTVLVAILPVICCGLVCQTLSILPDSEVLRAVDVLCGALERSSSCFSAFQWEILEERIYQCQQARSKAGTWLERRKGGARANHLPLSLPSTTTVPDRPRYRKLVGSSSHSSSSDDYGVSNDEQMSNQLVHSEGVESLVRRALRERQVLNYKRCEFLFNDNKKNNTHNSSSGDGGTSVSTLCPLSGTRLKIPARGIYCTHLTCFDLECYLETNAEMAISNSKMWRCPFCGLDATWPQIIVDGFILRILKTLPSDVEELLIWPDGRWVAKESPRIIEMPGKEVSSYPGSGSSARDNEQDLEEPSSSSSGVKASDARNVRQRVDDSKGDESIRDTKALELASSVPREGEKVSGNKTLAAAAAAAGMGDETMSKVDFPQKVPNNSSSRPGLHEIDLRGLIQSALEKSKLNSCSWGRKAPETLSISWR